MCDERTMADAERHAPATGGVTRREFGAIAMGTGLAVLWPDGAHAAEVEGRDVEVATPDGTADAYFAHPASGAHPGVLVWPDAFGLRPAMKQMAKRLAGSGYAVLVVNPYYRAGRAPLLPEQADFGDPATRKKIMSLMASLTPASTASDADAFVRYLDAQPAVRTDRKMGVTGYCMGGAMTLRTAAARPDRIGAGASFHGGRLVVDGPDSPHLLIPKIRAQYLVAIASNDDEQEPATKDVLRDAFAKAGLAAEIEVYEGALHGWCPPDSRVYDEAKAERAWGRLLALLERALA